MTQFADLHLRLRLAAHTRGQMPADYYPKVERPMQRIAQNVQASLQSMSPDAVLDALQSGMDDVRVFRDRAREVLEESEDPHTEVFESFDAVLSTWQNLRQGA
ncbi:MAG: hypothetical protein AAF557_19460 [Pseudomonadota bacterium]